MGEVLLRKACKFDTGRHKPYPVESLFLHCRIRLFLGIAIGKHQRTLPLVHVALVLVLQGVDDERLI